VAFDLENRGLIGRGAHGSVWLVYDRSQGRFLALKLVGCASWEEVDRRIEALRPLVSGEPNPWHVTPLELGRGDAAPEGIRRAFPTEVQGRPCLFVLMPHVHGPSATELAAADPAFGWAEAMAIGSQVASRLARRPPGAAHLDLKPENVLIDRKSGEVFLVDAHCGVTTGTPAYAAPEQSAPGVTPGPAADMFALGRLLRHLAARDVGPDVHAGILPPWPDIPAAWPPSRRSLAQDFTLIADQTLCQAEPERRMEAQPAASLLLVTAGAFAGPDLPGVLVASMSRAHLERVEREAAQLAKGSRGDGPQQGTSQAGNPLPQQGTSQTGNPLPQRGTSQTGNPLPQQETSQAGNPLPQQGTTQAGNPLPQQGTSQTRNPLPQRGTSQTGSPLPQRGRGQGEGATRLLAPRFILIAAGLVAAVVGFGLWPILFARHHAVRAAPAAPLATPREPVPQAAANASGCPFGQILAPSRIRCLSAGEDVTPPDQELSITVRGRSRGTSIVATGEDEQPLWQATDPPLHATVALALKGPHVYLFKSPIWGGHDWQYYCNTKRDCAPQFIDGEVEFSPGDSHVEDYAAIQKNEPRRLFHRDASFPRFTAPLKLYAGPRQFVRLDVQGPAELTWNVTEHPCDPPRMPMQDLEYLSPKFPFPLDDGSTLWLCPKPGQGPVTLHVEGYTPK